MTDIGTAILASVAATFLICKMADIIHVYLHSKHGRGDQNLP